MVSWITENKTFQRSGNDQLSNAADKSSRMRAEK